MEYQSPYVYADNNPVTMTDVWGMAAGGPDDPPKSKKEKAIEDTTLFSLFEVDFSIKDFDFGEISEKKLYEIKNSIKGLFSMNTQDSGSGNSGSLPSVSERFLGAFHRGESYSNLYLYVKIPLTNVSPQEKKIYVGSDSVDYMEADDIFAVLASPMASGAGKGDALVLSRGFVDRGFTISTFEYDTTNIIGKTLESISLKNGFESLRDMISDKDMDEVPTITDFINGKLQKIEKTFAFNNEIPCDTVAFDQSKITSRLDHVQDLFNNNVDIQLGLMRDTVGMGFDSTFYKIDKEKGEAFVPINLYRTIENGKESFFSIQFLKVTRK